MKIKLFLLLTGIYLISIANCEAQKCAVVDKKDAFTNTHIVETDEVKVYGAPLDVKNQGYFLSFQMKNDSIFICMNVSGDFMVTHSFSSVMLKFADNSIITLGNFFSTGVFNQGDFSWEKSYSMIDKLTLTKFANLKIINLRFFIHGIYSRGNSDNPLVNASNKIKSNTDSFIDNDLGSGKAGKVIKQANCMLLYVK